MLTILWTGIKRYSKAIAIVLAFVAGAYVTHLYESKKFTEYKNAELQSVISSYEEQLKNVEENRRRLASDLSDNRALLADRMREFEQWKLKHAGSKACQSERAIALAVRGEELLRRADSYLKALMR